MPQVKIIKPDEGKMVWAAGDHYTFKVTSEDTGGTYSLFVGLVPPQGGPPPHFHGREFEAFYILEGELTFHTPEGSIVAGPGAYAHIPMNVLHTFKNEGNRLVRMVAIVSPGGMENFLEDIGHPVYDRDSIPTTVTPADVEKIMAVAPRYGIGIVLPDRATAEPPYTGLQPKIIKAGEGEMIWAAGDHYTFKVTGQDTNGKYTLAEALVPPGGGPPPHTHGHEFEAFYVLEGTPTYHTQSGSVVVEPGTYIHIPKDVLHTFRNESNRMVRMLTILAPSGFENFLEETGHPVYDRNSTPTPVTPADIEKIVAVAPKYELGIYPPNSLPDYDKPIASDDAGMTGGRDDEARVTFYVLLWKRKSISLDAFDDYWRDVHGPVCARLPGQFQYWQFHVAHNDSGIFPAVDSVDYTTAEDDQFDGIAELTFRSVKDRDTWFTASAILMDDEHNIFSKAIGYVTESGFSTTYLDDLEVGNPNGHINALKYHVLVRQAPGVNNAEFRRYMTDRFAANVLRSRHILKFRLHLFEPPDLSRPDAAGVVHYEPPEKQYQAAYEIAFKNNLEREHFFASSEYAEALKDQARYVKQVCPFPERNPYTFVYNGRMTLAGQRGSRTAELITETGATNQLRPDIHSLIVGAVPHSRPMANNGNGR